MQAFLSTALLSLAAASPAVAGESAAEALVERDGPTVYGNGQPNTAISAPGVPYTPSYKGFPNFGSGPQQSNFLSALALNFLNPGWVPHGVNPVQCTPKDGQLPVILIPGTSETAYSNWAYLGPKLADDGICVYSFNHNPIALAGLGVPGMAFLGNISDSAAALGTFIDEVLAITGGDKVDLVGHSQGGGALPYYYLKNLDGAKKVRKHIGIAPSLGTEAYVGFNTILHLIVSKETEQDVNTLIGAVVNAASLDQQLSGSQWMQDLHKGGLLVDGVEYVNIATRLDDVLLPYTNCLVNEDGKNITNIVLQQVCGNDLSDHLGISYSQNVYHIVKNHLTGVDEKFGCVPQLPVIN